MNRAILLAAALALAGCGSPAITPETPAQAMVGIRAAEAGTLRLFREYTAQRPFCGDAGAKAPPLCAERSIVIEGMEIATQLHDGLAHADTVIKAAGVSDTSWKALAEPKTLLDRFRAFVARARNEVIP